MASADSIFWSGGDAHRALNHRYAALRFRQAAEQAREYKNEALWFKSIVWAAESHYLMGELREALSLIITARTEEPDRKSTRLNSSHQIISYAVFCLKK